MCMYGLQELTLGHDHRLTSGPATRSSIAGDETD